MAAAIAARYDAPAYFFRAGARTRTDLCLNHLCAELILRHNLAPDHLPEHAGENASFLSELLEQAAAGQRPVWLVIDGLDEVGHAGDGPGMPLPDQLPPRAFVLLTHREGVGSPLVAPGADTVVETLSLSAAVADDGRRRQRDDVKAYVHHRVTRDASRRRGYRTRSAACLARRCRRGLGHRQRRQLHLSRIRAQGPRRRPGARTCHHGSPSRSGPAYYQTMWKRMRPDANASDSSWELWDRLRLPVLKHLAVAAEAVTLQWLADHTGQASTDIRRRVLDAWPRFLAHVDQQPRRWHIVHQSFRDFLRSTDEVDVDGSARHRRRLLPRRPQALERHDGYALRHLTMHLRVAGKPSHLFELIEDRAWRTAQLGKTRARAPFSMTSSRPGSSPPNSTPTTCDTAARRDASAAKLTTPS